MIGNLGLYVERMYNVYNLNIASYEPRHEKIYLRGVRPGRRHKLAGDLNLVLRRELMRL